MYKQEKKMNPAVVGFLIALLMVVPLVLGVVFASPIKDFFTNLGKDMPTEEVGEITEEDIIGDVAVQIEDNSLMKLSKKRKISLNGEHLVITAEVKPSYAFDKSLTWSLTWVDGTNTDINQYVSIIPSSDTFSCEVKNLKAFDKQIILTCSKGLIKSTCTIDYVSRSTEIAFGVDEMDFCNTPDETIDYLVFSLAECPNSLEEVRNAFTFTNGTLTPTIKNYTIKEVYLPFAEDSDLYDKNFVEYLNNDSATLESILSENDLGYFYWFNTNSFDLDTGYDEGVHDITLVYELELEYNGISLGTCTGTFMSDGFFTDISILEVNDITLDDNQIIF